MPVYEYYCEICNDTIEDVRPLQKRDVKTMCSACGNQRVRKPSRIYVTPESLYGEWLGHRVIKQDKKSKEDFWEGSILEGRGQPNRATYKSERIQVHVRDYTKQ